jgi:hypothetical protein
VRLARRELAQANVPELDRRLGIVPGQNGDMVGAFAYQLQVEHEILRGLDAGEPAQDVALRVMLGSRLTGDQVWELVEVAMQRTAAARALELDTSSVPVGHDTVSGDAATPRR